MQICCWFGLVLEEIDKLRHPVYGVIRLYTYCHMYGNGQTDVIDYNTACTLCQSKRLTKNLFLILSLCWLVHLLIIPGQIPAVIKISSVLY